MRITTMFIGLYTITVFAFWIETGSIVHGLAWGAITTSLKTAWTHVHHKLWSVIDGRRCEEVSG